MRIVAGRFRGKAIEAPEGLDTRPTTDRVREALFNILSHRKGFSFEGARVLDLFAGTGALSLEAISRGAVHAVLVETGAEARGVIRTNLEAFGLFGEARILRRDATDLGPAGGIGGFNLVFCDPPYGKGLGEKAILSALKGGWIAPNALIVLEETRSAEPDFGGALEAVDARDYGETRVHLFTLAPSEP